MSTGSMQIREREQRRWPRRSVIGSSVIPIEAGLGETGGLILNLALGGAAMQLLGELQPEIRHPLRWQLSPEERWTEAQGVVVWRGANNTCGIRFVDLSEETQGRIACWTKEKHERILAPNDRHFPSRPSLPSDELSNLAALAKALLDADGAAFAVARGSDFVCISSAGTAPPAECLQVQRVLLAECLRTQAVVSCSDLAHDSRYQTESAEYKCASIVATPVTCGGHVIGVLECRWNRLREFDSHDLKILCSIAEVNPSFSVKEEWLTPEVREKATAPIQEISTERPVVSDLPLVKPLPALAPPVQHSGYRLWLIVAAAAALFFGISFAAGWFGANWTSSPPSTEMIERATATRRFPVQPLQPSQTPMIEKEQNAPAAKLEESRTSVAPLLVKPTAPTVSGDAESTTAPPDSLAAPMLKAPTIQLGQFSNTQDELQQLLAVKPRVPSIAPRQSPVVGKDFSPKTPVVSDVAGQASPPVLVKMVQPVYPEVARSTQRVGTVVLDVIVDSNGNVTQVRVVRGDAVLTQAAKTAVLRWHYRPAEIDGRRVQSEVRVTVNFKH